MRKVFFFALLFCSANIYSQSPITFESEDARVRVLQSPDESALEQQDELDEFKYRFGVTIPVKYSFDDFDKIKTVNDRNIYQLIVEVADAKALGVYFKDLVIPQGDQLFVLDDNLLFYGPYTEQSNTDGGSFATPYLRSNRITIQYEKTSNRTQSPIIEINELGYFYRGVNLPESNLQRDFGTSQSCEVNVNCPEGSGWENERDATVRISVKDGGAFYWCTGTVMNNTSGGCLPLVLSADHCAETASSNDLGQCIFYFNYQGATCNNPPSEAAVNFSTLTGCTKLAQSTTSGDEDSDFLLVKLNDTIPASFNTYYAGWDRSGDLPSNGVSIHHPDGDIKKISTFNAKPSSDSWGGITSHTHLRLNWVSTTTNHGVTEGGSSGAGLFDQNNRLVGTLTGGASTCSNPGFPDYFGKLWYHWDQDGSAVDRRVDLHLDPNQTGAVKMDGTSRPCVGLVDNVPTIQPETFKVNIYPNPTHGVIKITSEIDNANLQIINSAGKRVFKGAIGTRETLDLQLIPGVYIAQFQTEFKSFNQKLIVQP